MMILTFITTNQLYIYTHTYYKHIFKNKQKKSRTKGKQDYKVALP